MNSALKKISAYFSEVDVIARKGGQFTKKTVLGEFVPSSIDFLDRAFNYLIAKGILGTSLFCDAGCGDGRVILLTAGGFQIPSFGIEHDAEVAARAISNIKQLQGVTKVPVRVAMGDFTDDETYRSGGISFEDIGTFYNYVNNQGRIAKKIAKQSPKGTLFILYDGRQEPELFQGLTLELSLEINSDELIVRDPVNVDDSQPTADKAFLYVYRKLT